MSREREKILRMVADGTITPDEAEQLLNRLDPRAPTAVAEPSTERGERPPGPIKYLRVVINGGDDQRSSLTSVVVTFDSLVDVPDQAFTITNVGIPLNDASTPVTGLMVDTVQGATQTVTTITFGSGDSVVDRITANTLADGNYRLDINASLVTATGSGPAMIDDYQFGASEADDFFRLFGDDDGNGNVDFPDFSGGFLPAFGLSSTSPGYRDDMDADGDQDVDFLDFSQGFLPNFGSGRS